LYYRWSKEFLEAGKKRLLGDTQREATSTEDTDLRKENARPDMGRFCPYSSQLNGMPIIGHCRKRSFFFLST
jgi:hypothetical protein